MFSRVIRRINTSRILLKESSKSDKSLSDLQKALSVIENTLTKQTSSEAATEVPAIPITRRPFFPGFYKTVSLKDPDMIAAVREALSKNRPFVAAFLAKNNDFQGETIKNPDDVHHVGVLSQIYSLVPGPNESMTLLLFPHRRVRMQKLILPPLKNGHSNRFASTSIDHEKINEELENEETDIKNLESLDNDLDEENDDESEKHERTFKRTASNKSKKQPLVARVSIDPIKDVVPDKEDSNVKDLVFDVNALLNQIASLNPLVREQTSEFIKSIGSGSQGIYSEPGKLADFSAAMCDAPPDALQAILEEPIVKNRLRNVLGLLKNELVAAKLQNDISKGLDNNISDSDREFFLNERLKSMQKELGVETVSRDKIMEKFKSKMAKLVVPEAIRVVFDEEMGRLRNLRPASQEYHLAVSYLDWITQIPWGKHSTENFDIQNAQKVLDEEHFGMADVKDRILEFIAVGKLRGSVQGKILCLSGPPGVGKTSIGKSIAKALNREFYRFSVGGLYDVAEIKGHRRTYVGAMPGKLVQALKKVQTENPLILIDEVDKVGRGGHSGDPSSALLEVLDPEQNTSFLDHYMDVPIDLSKILFVCTANVLDTIPGPLIDRMEVIQLSGYVAQEKLAIAKNYLVPQARQTVGLSEEQLVLTDDAIESLNSSYCRESGVRNLKKHIEKIFRKVAFQVVSKDEATTDEIGTKNDLKTSPIVVSSSNLNNYVGGPIYNSERMYDMTPAGIVCGLAYSSIGGSVLYIESILETPITDKSKGRHRLTGNLGNVMKESCNIAYSYAKHFISIQDPENKYFSRAGIHTHVPEGATPKDGPSAGIALCSSLISLALNKPLTQDIAMTGELSLSGKVLRIGGVKEKVMGARRSGIKRLILPVGNKSDFEELADYLKTGIDVTYVDTYNDVFNVIFKS